MQTLKEVARAGRFAAMQPAAIAERLALNAAIDRAALAGAQAGQVAITLLSHQHPCRPMGSRADCNSVSLYPPADIGGVFTSAMHINRRHGNELGKTWYGTQTATDSKGRVWERWFNAVVDDFGNLVEVQ